MYPHCHPFYWRKYRRLTTLELIACIAKYCHIMQYEAYRQFLIINVDTLKNYMEIKQLY